MRQNFNKNIRELRNVMVKVAEKINSCFQLKGGLFTITVLQLHYYDLERFETHLQETLQQAPKFFQHAPIVIDLNEFNFDKNFEIEPLIVILRQNNLIPFGIRGGSSVAQSKAVKAGLAILHNSIQSNPAIANKEPKKLERQDDKTVNDNSISPATGYTQSRVITQPVRSGQQIYAKNADLIVLSPVSHGAEILADGHIHIYGPLRGRALAGIMGNTEAKIFCKSLDAELVSIAGRYLVSEQLEKYKNTNDLHIFLENDQLKVSQLF